VKEIPMRASLKTDNPKLSSYGPDDLNFMQGAFVRACNEHPEIARSEDRRETLAKAIVNSFEAGMSEADLIKLALQRH
jgi:hypothetical protein